MITLAIVVWRSAETLALLLFMLTERIRRFSGIEVKLMSRVVMERSDEVRGVHIPQMKRS
jgi:hypothetical protein